MNIFFRFQHRLLKGTMLCNLPVSSSPHRPLRETMLEPTPRRTWSASYLAKTTFYSLTFLPNSYGADTNR